LLAYNDDYNGEIYDNIIIHENTKFIGDYAFNYMSYSYFEDIKIPDSVMSIGEGAFSYLSATSLTLGNGIKYIGYDAFSDCQFSTFFVPDTVETYSWFFRSSADTVYCETDCSKFFYLEYGSDEIVAGHVHFYDDGRCVCGRTE
jgi:hypothetical protein